MCDNASPDSAELSRAVSLLEEIGRNERHFNSLQSDYRKLASAWLLAALGAVGYTVLSDAAAPTKAALYFVIGVGNVAGLFVLWLLDMRVYHRLLESVFKVAEEIERKYPALPQLHAQMAAGTGRGSVSRSISTFYVAIGSAVPLCVVILSHSSLSSWHVVLLLGLPVAMAVTVYSPWKHAQAGKNCGHA